MEAEVQELAVLTPIQEEAVQLYRKGRDLREVAGLVGRSHEWVRKTLGKAGVQLRRQGRSSVERSACERCGKLCPTPQARFCSRDCLNIQRHETAMTRVLAAKQLLDAGETFASAAEKSGFKSGWELYGRLYHFGLIERTKASEQASGGD